MSHLHIRHEIFFPCLTLSASAVHPDWEDHEEAHPWWAPGPEDHIWGAHPEVLGCSYRPCESIWRRWQFSSSLFNKANKWSGNCSLFDLFTANKEETWWCQQTSGGALWQTQRADGECPAGTGLLHCEDNKKRKKKKQRRKKIKNKLSKIIWGKLL